MFLPRQEGDKGLPAFLPQPLTRRRWLVPALMVLAVAMFLWPARELRSDNFIFYFPSGRRMLPLEATATSKFLPLLQVLNLVGKVEGIQEKQTSLRVWFGSTQLEMSAGDNKVHVGKTTYTLSEGPHVSEGQWMVPLDFLTAVLPLLTHQAVEYQTGTNRIFIGDVKPVSFTVRLDPIADGARLTVQFTESVAVRTASSNGKWIMYLGDRPMEPMEPSYHFDNPYLSDLQYDDQDGVPKLIISPTSGGLNFYPVTAEGGKILLADVLKPPAPSSPGTAVGAGNAATASAPAAPGQVSPPAAESPGVAPGLPLPVVALDAGHGGEDNGAHSRDGVLEKNLAAQYVARVRSALLATNNFRVVLTRTGDAQLSADQRDLAANLSGAICFLSFHAGDLGTEATRITVFTFAPSMASAPPSPVAALPTFVPWQQVQENHLGQSFQLAFALQQQLAALSGVEVDMPSTAPLRTLRSVNAPAVAIELGPLASDADASALTNVAFQQQVAGAVVRALANFQSGGG